MTTTPTLWGDETLINTTAGDHVTPEVTHLDNGGFVVAWVDFNASGIRIKIFDELGGSLLETAVPTEDIFTGFLSEENVSITALADGGFAVVYAADSDTTDQQDILMRRFDADGTPRDANHILVNTTTTGAQDHASAVGLADGGLVVVWEDGGAVTSTIRGRRYDANGNAIGNDFIVNQATAVDQFGPNVEALAGGGFVVGWSTSDDGDDSGVVMRVFNALGVAVTGNLQANVTTQSFQTSPQIAGLATGNFVMVWQDNSNTGFDTQNYSVRGRIFSPFGDPLTDEFLVNTTVQSYQAWPTITTLADGGFLVAWDDGNGDGNGSAVQAQRFDAEGNRIGVEFFVNTTTTGNQGEPGAATLSDGRVVVAFQEFFAGDGDVRFQILDPRDAEFEGTNEDDVMPGTIDDSTIHGRLGNDAITGMNGDDTLFGDAGDDTLTGGLGNDRLMGGSGDDTLFSGAEDDVVDGGSGNDTIIGGEGAGNDFYIGGPDTDTISYTSATQAITVNLATGKASGAEIDSDTLSGIENVTGGSANDTLIGSSANNVLDGGPGNDSLSYTAANAGVSVSLAILTAQNTGGGGTDTLSSIENLIGSRFADQLTGDGSANGFNGGAGNDTLRGGSGDDVLTGGAGRDFLYGDAGRDFFDFNSKSESKKGGSRDKINHFQRGQDDIDLRTIDAKSGSGNQTFKWIGKKDFSDKKGELRYDDNGSKVIVQGDINGDGKADFEIFVAAGSLGKGDFLL